MKRCPFCAEEIQEEAIKCRFCNEFLKSVKDEKWYLKTHLLIISFLTVGPFALPLLWINPNYSKKKKIIVTFVVVVVSVILITVVVKSLQVIIGYYKQVFEMM